MWDITTCNSKNNKYEYIFKEKSYSSIIVIHHLCTCSATEETNKDKAFWHNSHGMYDVKVWCHSFHFKCIPNICETLLYLFSKEFTI